MAASEPARPSMLDRLKARARALNQEALAIYFAARDPRTPWYVKALIFFVVAHTFSPIDLIPDFIPILGYLDDLIITPGGLWLAVRLIPAQVMADSRAAAAAREIDERVAKIGALLVVLAWVTIFIALFYLVLYK